MKQRKETFGRRQTRFFSPTVAALCVAVVMVVACSISVTQRFTQPEAGTTLRVNLVPSITPPVSSCFGGGTCTGTYSNAPNGEGTSCEITGYLETAGDFMYIAVNYLGGSNTIISVSDSAVDTINYVGGYYATGQSVAFYDVLSEHGGTVSVTITASAMEWGTCRVGQLSMGTAVGVVGAGGSSNAESDTTLSISDAAAHTPSLVMALFGSTRPSGPWESPLPTGSWINGGFLETGYNPGTNSELIAYNDSSGTVTLKETTENSGYDIYLSGIAVEFYLPSPPANNCFGGANPCTGTSTSTTAGKGTTCVISSFSETVGDFLYVAVNYLGSTNLISSVTAGSVSASFVGGEFGTSASVAFYDIASEAGGTVAITVTLSSAEFGTCRAGQLEAGTEVGVVGAGGTTGSATATSLSVTNAATHEPSFLLALFDSTRPSGAWTYSDNPSGSWVTGGNLLTGYNPGTNSYMFGYNDTTPGTVTFSVTLGDTASSGNGNIYLSGIAVEFYLPVTYGWIGYDNNAIYPTNDPYAVPLQSITRTSSQPQSAYEVANSIALASFTQGSNLNDESYFQFIGNTGPNTGELFVQISFAAAGMSQYYYEYTSDFETQYIGLTLALPSTLPNTGSCATGTCASFTAGFNSGLNVSQSGSNEGSSPAALLAAVAFAIEVSAALDPETFGAPTIAALIFAAVELLIDAASDVPNGNGYNSNTGPAYPGQTLNQWSSTDNGALTACQESLFGVWSCPNGYGSNFFGIAETASLTIPIAELGNVQSGGAVSLGGQNEVGEVGFDSQINNIGAYVGQLNFPVAPAVGLGGTVYHAGQAVNGATVTIIQNYNGVTTYFAVTSGYNGLAYGGFPTGYWNFFANPAVFSSGGSYSYYCSYDGTNSPVYSVPSGAEGTWDGNLNADC